MKLNFELLTRGFNFNYSTFKLQLDDEKQKISFRVTNSKLKNKKFNPRY